MPRTQGIREQGTLSCLIRVRKRQKRWIPGSAAFEDTPALGLPRAACCPSATAKSLLPARLCWHFLPQPPPHSRLCSHCHSALPTAPHQCPSPAETTPTPLHQPVTCTWGCAFSVACAGQTNADFFFFFLHCRIPKQSEFNQATGETAGSDILNL